MIITNMENQLQYNVHVHGSLDLFKELIKVSRFRQTERASRLMADLNSNLALTLVYLNPALDNPPQE